MAQIQPLNNDTIHKPSNDNPASTQHRQASTVLHQNQRHRVEWANCSALKIKLFALADNTNSCHSGSGGVPQSEHHQVHYYCIGYYNCIGNYTGTDWNL